MNRKSWRYMIVLLSIWLLILAYMGWHLFVLVGDSNRNQAALDRKERHVDLLKSQNLKLKEMVSDLQSKINNLEMSVNAKEQKFKKILKRMESSSKGKEDQAAVAEKGQTEELQKKADLSSNNGGSTCVPSSDAEEIRRRTEYEVKELWYYLSAEITKINKKTSLDTKSKLSNMLKNVELLHHHLTTDMEKRKTLEYGDSWRQKEHEELSQLVQSRFEQLQNPEDCSSTKKLICQINKGCGYGCQAHHVLYCFIVAFGLQRTLVIDSTGWRYSSRGWEGVFKPVSKTCLSYSGHVDNWGDDVSNSKNVLLPIVDSLYPRPAHMPLAVPQDLSKRLSRLHGHPFVWWIGQFTKYLFRFTPGVQKEIDEKKKKLGFKHPIVGVQVRRTDKINTEAAFHSIEEYMYWVQLYYKQRSKKEKIDKKRVFLATDDPSVLPEAEQKYKDYEFISDNSISKSAGLGSRYSDSSLHGVIFDIQMLSECDFLVCTFSSQVCRLGYEIMQSKHPDASRFFQSLDDIYYFGGQSGHNVRAVVPHKAQSGEEIDLEVGDLVGIAGNHWDGYSKGTNHRTGQTGLYPSWKVEEVMETARFPTYNQFGKE